MSTREVDVDVRMSWPISNQREDRYANLVITDRLSGMQVINLELNAEQLTNLLAGSGAKTSATVQDSATYERIGKEYVWARIEFPEGLIGSMVREVNDAMREFAAREAVAGGWEGSRWIYHNYGWELIGWKYVEVSE